MLDRVGVRSVDELLTAIPRDALRPKLGLPAGLSEIELQSQLEALAARNRPAAAGPFFLGGPVQRRYIPAAVPVLALRGEFLTAYTPYQPEVSQGTLQTIFEYQSLMCELLAMEVANSSMYDGSTAVAEAAFMAVRVTGRKKVVVAREVFHQYRATLRTYARGPEVDVVEVPTEDLAAHAGGATCLIVQHPDSLGALVDVRPVARAAHASGALCVQVTEPHACTLLEPPGECGVDVAVGEGQPLGNRLDFGGPSFGWFAATEPYLRRMPGRIAGETRDVDGRRGFVLTLQTREQHIRREKATSNICTNVALCALMATIYLAIMGKRGLSIVGELSLAKAHYAAAEFSKVPGVRLRFTAPFFKEFTLQLPKSPDRVVKRLMKDKILAGLPLKALDRQYRDCLLVAVTEKRTREEIDAYCRALATAVA